MSTAILLGIDVGTSGVKVVASTLDGRMLRDGVARYPTAVGTGDSGAEQDAEAWWSALAEICSRVVADSPVASVAVTSQAPTLVPIDDEAKQSDPRSHGSTDARSIRVRGSLRSLQDIGTAVTRSSARPSSHG